MNRVLALQSLSMQGPNAMEDDDLFDSTCSYFGCSNCSSYSNNGCAAGAHVFRSAGF